MLPEFIEIALAVAHPSWQEHLRIGLNAMLEEQPDYFSDLITHEFFPTENRLFAAFSQPVESVRFVLLGEGPYPRAQSATGVCFMDGAVKSIWQPGVGLSTSVNRATSLRNFIKMLLVAEGELSIQNTRAEALKLIAKHACTPESGWIQTGAELQTNLLRHGFLLLNASLVFRSCVSPTLDAKAWNPFLRTVLQVLSIQNNMNSSEVTLILWGKIAEKIKVIPEASCFSTVISEHPYNLSFIGNQVMQNVFKEFHLLKRR